MRKLLRLVWCTVALTCSLLAVAQDQAITGTVKDPKDNSPLAGATIVNQRTKKTVLSNEEGKYTIVARPGDLLLISHVGRQNMRLTITTATTYNTLLQTGGEDMGEAVVTAMDIKRNPRELGYSLQKISGTDVKETQRPNLINSLQGRIAGATVTPTNGQAGASAQIILRGFNSLSLSNSPLFVVDGVLIDNSTLSQASNGGTGIGLASDGANHNNDYTNRVADLSPNDIESITVLKGPEATALYGSQASSGAILITTKRNNTNGVSVSYDNAFGGQKITRFNQEINTYSPGNNGIYGANFGTKPVFYGPAYDPKTTQLYDNKHHFFNTGFSQVHNLSVDFGKKISSFRLSASYTDQNGVVPTNDYTKENIRLANTTHIGKILDITPSVSYIHTVNDKPLRGIGGYLTDLYVWRPDLDVRKYLNAQGRKLVLNPADSTNPNGELDNPLYSATQNKSKDKTDRVFSTLAINFNPLPWLSVAGRFGYDYYSQTGYTFYNPESSEYSTATGGYLDNYYKKYFGYNHTITATAHKSMGKFNGRLMVGTMWQNQETHMFAVSGSKLIDSSSVDSSNTTPNTRTRLLRNNYGLPNLQIFRDQAYFGEASVNYDNVLFVTFSERWEESSVFPKANRNYSYPGVSFSAILSDLIPGIKGNVLDYWKFRTSMAQTARLADPYSNQSVFVNSTSSGGGFGYGVTNSNENLKPERQKTFEIGTELRMLNNRLSIDATYYNTKVTDQIVEGYRASYATGFLINTANVADTRNQGIEATVTVNPVRNRDWNWNIVFNFNKMYSKVLRLPASLSEYYLGDTQIFGSAGVSNTAIRSGLRLNGPTTTLTGWHYARNNAGAILIDPATGLPQTLSSWSVLGDRNPHFTLGTTNVISYKSWTLSFLWDLKAGGAVYNGTDAYLTQTGRSKRTADRETTRIVNGVLNDGFQNTANPTKNNLPITPAFQQAYYTLMPDEEFIQKQVNWFRLRDLTLNYDFRDASFMKNQHFVKHLGVFVTATDLLLFTNYYGADPAVNGTTASNQGIGGFGIDYGNLPAPISINIGLKASF